MKTIGIIGGLSPESTTVYYKQINEGTRARTDRQHQAKIIIVSVDGGEIWQLRQKGDWEGQGKIIADAAVALEKAGADFTLLAGNTMHRMADAIEAVVQKPFLHIIDATAHRIKATGVTKIGLTGTSPTLTEKFYVDRLAKHGIASIIPDAEGIKKLDHMIYKELIWGNISPESKREYTSIVNQLIDNGAEGVILGCTELTLFTPLDCDAPLFDTTQIHIEDALTAAFE
jgi:aspartate racemase